MCELRALEAAVVVTRSERCGRGGRASYWHLPLGRTATALPDSRALWVALWDRREALLGVAHSHPGWGPPRPSRVDLETFDACERGLGLRLRWWIATRDRVRCFGWVGPGPLDYAPWPLVEGPAGARPGGDGPEALAWLPRLRLVSYGPPSLEASEILARASG